MGTYDNQSFLVHTLLHRKKETPARIIYLGKSLCKEHVDYEVKMIDDKENN